MAASLRGSTNKQHDFASVLTATYINDLANFMKHGLIEVSKSVGSEKDPEFVGTVAKENPVEFLHKVRFGQPGSNPTMPSAIVNQWTMQQIVDVAAFAQTLPEK